MIGKLKQKSIEKYYNKLIERKPIVNSKNGKVKSIAVILDNESLVNVIQANLTNKLPFKKEDITFLVQREFSKKQEITPMFFTEEELGYKASLKSDNLKNFVKKEYDLLINYTKSSNLYTNVITLQSQAKLKVGFAEVDDRLYDLVVADTTFNEAILNQELKKYLTILNKI
ncbi:DUF6913 domain-containing protein [Tenacibaculum halocynthiae]|uniref:DUF6913 domain-containing protein n=1 Tax=Tenacibaculum halocynthiae TaxID=1254437 RepID=UPI00261DA2E6|nr:hypothetical protein [uncultured Tenacibaculum sp.]